ncbi:MAG: hypothetical protein HY908_24455 [Myxococcales bacterium]|nr:hypothetical protein [Myxococcales bacterium]
MLPRSTLPSPRRPRRYRRALLAALAFGLLFGPSCAASFLPSSYVNSLRVLAVTIDAPYAAPGDEVTFRMTVHDGLDPENGPRAIQVVWIGGCFDPEGDRYYLCFQQLAETLAGLAGGGPPPTDLLKLDIVAPTSSGMPDLSSFTLRLPDDLISRRPPPVSGPHYGIGYVFFAACAGTLAPGELTSPSGGAVPDFPIKCLDANGQAQGPESFVPGYTQVYAFADGRSNTPPTVSGIRLGDNELPEDAALAPTVPRCPLSADDRRKSGCARPTDDACVELDFEVLIGDVAEVDPDSKGPLGETRREVVWESHFADGGDFASDLLLVSSSEGGPQPHVTSWTPPAEPGLVTFWAVGRDQRGGASVVRRFVRVE